MCNNNSRIKFVKCFKPRKKFEKFLVKLWHKFQSLIRAGFYIYIFFGGFDSKCSWRTKALSKGRRKSKHPRNKLLGLAGQKQPPFYIV